MGRLTRSAAITQGDWLSNLIDQYWSIAYKEGQERRDHDTEEGDAQKCRHLIETSIKALVKAASHD